MKIYEFIALATGILVAGTLASRAQTDNVTVTNVVTLTVTNVVTVTNIINVPASAAASATVEPVVKYPWESSVSAGLTLTRGNSHTLLYSGDFLTAKKTPDNEYTFGVGGAYGSQDSQDNINNYHASGQWNHFFTEKLYGYLRADAMRDIIADIDYRLNIGPGIGYYFIKETNTTLAGEAGAGYQYEHLGSNYNSFATLRLAERFEHKFSDRARLWQSVEWLPQVDQLDNYIVNFKIGIEASITKSLSLQTCLDDSFATQPAAGRQKNDIKLVSGIAYKF